MINIRIPKELTEYKSKVIFGLTGRQLVCFGIAMVIGVPVYFAARTYLGSTIASYILIAVSMPCFAFAVIKKNELPLEKYLKVAIRNRFTPQVRKYQNNNSYDTLIDLEETEIVKLELLQKKESKKRKKGKKDTKINAADLTL